MADSALPVINSLWVSMRPKQWVKNLLLFAALFFSQNLFRPRLFLTSVAAFITFCLLSSAIYLINDLIDIDKDKKHPEKCHRPLASGRLDPFVAKISCVFFLALSLLASFLINRVFAGIAFAYLLLQILYSNSLREAVLLDVFSIAAGFFLRVVAGAKAIEVPMSSWLLLCTLFLSLFLALGKRRYELIVLGERARDHRKALDEYNMPLLDQMLGVATAGSVISYSLYTLSDETVKKFHTENLWYTIPVVLYGIFRYLYLVYRKKQGGHPELFFFEDRPLLLTVLLYILIVGAVLYF